MDNPPAFPFIEPSTSCNVNTGMTLLDYFAAQAMNAMNQNPDWDGADFGSIAAAAYDQAREMLKERSKDEL